MSFTLVKNLTKINYSKGPGEKRIKYIVIHYFGSLGTALAVSNYFKSKYRGASAHLCLDEGNKVYQSVEFKDIAWHCGTKGKYYSPCRNSNSVGIEVRPHKLSTKTMSVADKDWYFDDETTDRLVEVTKWLMKKYNIDASHVIRHYDVTRKACPRPYVGTDINTYYDKAGQAMWTAFKARLVDTPEPKQEPFLVRITAKSLNVRSGPGVKHPINMAITDQGVYTIVDTNKNWGLLKSGAGWISLTYTEKLNNFNPYLVRITASALNIRSGPGVKYPIQDTIRGKGVYTIVDEQEGWGLLKSGVGWISLHYTVKL